MSSERDKEQERDIERKRGESVFNCQIEQHTLLIPCENPFYKERLRYPDADTQDDGAQTNEAQATATFPRS